jgi:hypothetical protein
LGASKEQPICSVQDCARWICSGAELSITKRQDVDTAEALKQKWKRCDGFMEFTPHLKAIVEQRSHEDLENMLRDAFADMEELIVHSEAHEEGPCIVKADARQPDAGEKWY